MIRTLRTAVLFFSLACAGGAADFAALQPQGYVNDFANVISPQLRDELQRFCKEIETATGAQFALVTVTSLDGEPIEDVANFLYRRWGVGNKKTNEGLLLLIAIRDRRTRLEVGYGLEPVIPDGYAGSLLREMRPALRDGDVGSALAAATRTLGQRVAAAKGVSLQTAPRVAVRHDSSGEPSAWIPALSAMGILFFALFIKSGLWRRRVTHGPSAVAFEIMSAMLGSGGPSVRGGGGFGGYDSGDSFGGFGGGDSGGGGASSDW